MPGQSEHQTLASLPDLPNELLLKIFNDLSFFDQYNLSILCRRLNFLFLSTYLAQYGITNPTFETTIPIPSNFATQSEELLGMRNAVYVKFITHLTCKLGDLLTHTAHYYPKILDPFAVNMQRATRLILRLDKVENVSLLLHADSDVLQESEVSDFQLISWCVTLGNMLNAIVERGCTAFTVENGSYMFLRFAYGIRRPLPTPLKQNQHHTSYVFHRLNGIETTEVLLSNEARSNSTIRIFNIHSTLLLLPPCLNWTLSLIRASPLLTEISLGSISFSSHHIWNIILPPFIDAVSNKLTKLTILPSHTSMQTEQLLQLIYSLPHLRSLSIDPCIPFSPSLPALLPRDISSLANLKTLTAPLEFILHFLSLPSQRYSLPQLQTIHTYIYGPLLIHNGITLPNPLEAPAFIRLLELLKMPPRVSDVTIRLDSFTVVIPGCVSA